MIPKIITFLLTFFIYFSSSFVLPTYASFKQGECSGDSDIETAIGCIPTDNPTVMVNKFVTIGVGLGGGFALLLCLYGVFIVTTSAGIPDKLKEGQEIITSAISGLIFIALSIVLFNLIGINILALPGLK